MRLTTSSSSGQCVCVRERAWVYFRSRIYGFWDCEHGFLCGSRIDFTIYLKVINWFRWKSSMREGWDVLRFICQPFRSYNSMGFKYYVNQMCLGTFYQIQILFYHLYGNGNTLSAINSMHYLVHRFIIHVFIIPQLK